MLDRCSLGHLGFSLARRLVPPAAMSISNLDIGYTHGYTLSSHFGSQFSRGFVLIMTQQLGRNVTTQLDRIITIQQLSVTRDSFGAEVETWVDLAQVWASFTPQSAREQFRNESNIIQASNTAAFRIRYRDDLTEDMRIVHDGHEWGHRGYNRSRSARQKWI